MQHQIEEIVRNPQDYKYCDRCGKINRHGNKRCHGCAHRIFNRMDDKYARTLILDWKKEPDLPLEV
jgi:hypothetical protein